MPILRTALLAGLAATGLVLSGAASAQTTNVMTVRVPGGGVAEIRYQGAVPPQIVFLPEPAAYGWVPAASPFGAEPPFAMLDRIAAEMDRQAAAMFRYADTLASRAGTGQPIETAFGSLPPGSRSYSYISTMSGNGVCTRSVRITVTGNGPPQVERHSAGNCAPAAAAPGAARVMPAAPAIPAKQPDLILTRNAGPSPYAGMVRQVAAAR